MAKYNVTHSCGHTQEHTLFGPGKARESKLEWLATTPCTDCWKAQQREKNDAEGPKWSVNVIPAYDPKEASERHAAAAIRKQIDVDRLQECPESARGWDYRTHLERAQRAVKDEERYAQSALQRPARAAAVEFICVNSFPIKDQLKARGYRYSPDAVSEDLLGMKTVPGWTKQFATDAEIKAEAEWIVSNGWELPEAPSLPKQLLDAVALGREDLLPMAETDTVAAATEAREVARRQRATDRANLEARMKAKAEQESKAASFRTGPTSAVTLKAEHAGQTYDFAVGSGDGRTAYGWNSDGDWFAVLIVRPDGTALPLPGGSPEGDRIGRSARDLYKSQQQ